MLHYLICDAGVPTKGSELIQVLETCPSDSHTLPNMLQRMRRPFKSSIHRFVDHVFHLMRGCVCASCSTFTALQFLDDVLLFVYCTLGSKR